LFELEDLDQSHYAHPGVSSINAVDCSAIRWLAGQELLRRGVAIRTISIGAKIDPLSNELSSTDVAIRHAAIRALGDLGAVNLLARTSGNVRRRYRIAIRRSTGYRRTQ